MQFPEEFRNQFEQLIKWRRDVRRFKTSPVDQKLIGDLLGLTNYAPSVGLSQPWRFVEIKSADIKVKIIESFEKCNAEALNSYEGEKQSIYARLKLEGLKEAPLQFAVFADETTRKGSGLGRQTMPEMIRYSVVTAIHTFWLAARASGLGVGWVSILDPREVKQAADVPENWSLVAYLCVGWPVEECQEPELENAGWEKRATTSPPWLVR